MPSLDVERMLFLRERGIIGQIINSDSPMTASLAGRCLAMAPGGWKLNNSLL